MAKIKRGGQKSVNVKINTLTMRRKVRQAQAQQAQQQAQPANQQPPVQQPQNQMQQAINLGLQQFAFAVGGYGKPDVVSDAQLDKMPGVDLYRTVNAYKNRAIGTNYTAQEIADQVLYADYTVYNSGGGMAYGNGLYFADSYTNSAGYGDYYPRSGKPDIRMVRAKVTGKIIGSSSLKSKFRADNSQMAKQIRSSGWSGSEQMAVYAIAKGYTAIQHGSYYTIVNRSGLAFSNRVKDNIDYSKIGHKW